MEHKEIKLKDIFKECMQKKIVLTIVLVGSLLFGGLFFGLVFNRVNEQYSMNFSLSFEGINNGQYPNGNDFLFKKMISQERVSEIIRKSESINNLDANLIYNHLSISQRNGSDNKKNYTISISKKYINNAEAKELFMGLINLEYDRILANSNTVTNENLALFRESNNYDDQINLLISQVKLLIDKYDFLIEKNGNVSYNGKTLKEYQERLIEYYDSCILQGINVLIKEKGFVKDYDAEKELLEYKKKALLNDRNINKKIIDDMTAVINSTTNTVLDDELMIKLMDIIEKNVYIDEEIKSIDNKLLNTITAEEKLEFETNLNKQAETVADFTETYKNVFANYSVVKIDSTDVFTGGTVNIFVGMLLCMLFASIIYFSFCAIRVYKRS